MTAAWSSALSLTVRAGLTPAQVYDRAVFDAGTFQTAPYALGLAGTDVTAYVAGLSTARGRTSAVDRFRAGTARLTMRNDSGDWSPWSASSPWAGSSGQRLVAPGLPLYVVATVAGTGYALAGVYVDTATEASDGYANLVHLECTDGLKYLATLDRTPQAAQGAGESSAARLARVLTDAGWSGWRGTFTAYSGIEPTMRATTLEGRALDELQAAGDAGGGDLYTDAGFGLRWYPQSLANAYRVAALAAPGSLTVLTDGPVGAGELGYSSIALAVDDEPLRNRVTIASAATALEVSARDEYSIARLGEQSERRTLEHDSDAWSSTLAAWLLTVWSIDPVRASSVTLSLDRTTPAATWAKVLALDLTSYVRVRRRWGGRTLLAVYRVEGIAHDVTADTWTVTLSLWPAGGLP